MHEVLSFWSWQQLLSLHPAFLLPSGVFLGLHLWSSGIWIGEAVTVYASDSEVILCCPFSDDAGDSWVSAGPDAKGPPGVWQAVHSLEGLQPSPCSAGAAAPGLSGFEAPEGMFVGPCSPG